MKFFYQLKVKDEKLNEWQDIWLDIGEAPDKKTLIANLKNELSAEIMEKISRKNTKPVDYRIFAVELTEYWEKHWCSVRTCRVCSTPFTLIQARQNGVYANYEMCSSECRKITRRAEDFGGYAESYINQDYRPCIYKITNKSSQMVYIGQTVQCFTLRWYQHFFQAGDSKFHQAIKSSQPNDWTFEVIEVLETPVTKKEIDAREMHWITHYDSINNGYNTAQFKLLDIDESTKNNETKTD